MNPTRHYTERIGYLFRCLLRLGILVFGLAVACAGCMAHKSYIDPQFHDADYQSIKVPDSPRPVTVAVTFLTNGSPNEAAKVPVRTQAVKVLTATRVFTERTNPQTSPAGRIEITVNNIGDTSEAMRKGWNTGASLGLVGNEIVDGYEMTATYAPAGGSPVTRTYKHAIHHTFGAHSALEGMELLPSGDAAFERVLEDMLLNFVRDLQKDGTV